MNKLLVLAKNQETYFIKRLKEEWKETLQISDSILGIENGPVLVRNSGVYRDSSDLESLNKRRLDVINTVPMLELTRSKWLQYQNLKISGLKFPPTLNLKNSTFNTISDFINEHSIHDFCLKPHYGQGGWGVKKISADTFLKDWEKMRDFEYVLQPYVEHIEERRCFFMGDQMIFLKKNKRGIVGNFSQGTKAEIIHDEKFRSLVTSFINQNGLFYGAFDYLVTAKDEFILLELNLVPGIEQVESLVDVNLMQRWIELLKKSAI